MGSRTQDTWLELPVLCHEPQQLDNHQPSQSKVIYCQCEARCSEHLVQEKTLGMGSFLLETIFWSTPNEVLTAHTEWLSGLQLRHSVTICTVHIEDCQIILYESMHVGPRTQVQLHTATGDKYANDLSMMMSKHGTYFVCQSLLPNCWSLQSLHYC